MIMSETVFCETWLFEATGVAGVPDIAREQFNSKSTEDNARTTAMSHVSCLYVPIGNLLLFVFSIPCVSLLQFCVSVGQKINFLGGFVF